MGEPAVVDFSSYEKSIPTALDEIGAAPILAEQKAILIKPNLTQSSPPPITTPVACCEAVVRYIRSRSKAEVVIAEGCGAISYDTEKVFRDLGYEELASRLKVPLINLNTQELTLLRNPKCAVFPEFHMPRIALDHYIISVPVLKAHSFSKITGTLKNMMGFAPPKFYQVPGHWKKALFHDRMHEAIVDLNHYRKPDLSIVDASVGLAEYHLGGKRCHPPVSKIVAGFDPVQVDRISAELLGFDWRKIPHLNAAI